jgi:predicted dehydrogenase
MSTPHDATDTDATDTGAPTDTDSTSSSSASGPDGAGTSGVGTDGLHRRDFLRRAAAAGVGLGVAGHLQAAFGAGAPNERAVVGVMGVNSRGAYLAEVFARAEGAEVGYVCDVDRRARRRVIEGLTEPDGGEALQERRPEGVADVRRMLEQSDLDALVIAAPDHWHAPAAMMALDAGKHVYVEKPCSHNPREGEMLVQKAEANPDLVVQMGNQQRSSARSIRAVEQIRDGIIGEPYYGRAWYANARGPTTFEAGAAVPGWLDYELWQGPAPRQEYLGNLVHYNWHWRWHWGTAEICNNGTHEIDVCRWALGAGRPEKVTSSGGRYHFDDGWEAFDTQTASFEFPGDKMITWEGRSCNANPIKGSGGDPGGGRGASIHGTEGTVLIDRGGYVVYDNDNNLIEYANEVESGRQVSGTGTVGGGSLTENHVANFLAGIRGEEALRAPIAEGRESVLLCHLGNIAQRTGGALEVDPETGRPQGEEAMALWSRDYEPGWEPSV